MISGKQRHVRLVPVRALDGDDVEWIKVNETKGCITLTTGMMRSGPPSLYCLCVAVKRQVKNSYLLGEPNIFYKILFWKIKVTTYVLSL